MSHNNGSEASGSSGGEGEDFPVNQQQLEHHDDSTLERRDDETAASSILSHDSNSSGHEMRGNENETHQNVDALISNPSLQREENLLGQETQRHDEEEDQQPNDSEERTGAPVGTSNNDTQQQHEDVFMLPETNPPSSSSSSSSIQPTSNKSALSPPPLLSIDASTARKQATQPQKKKNPPRRARASSAMAPSTRPQIILESEDGSRDVISSLPPLLEEDPTSPSPFVGTAGSINASPLSIQQEQQQRASPAADPSPQQSFSPDHYATLREKQRYEKNLKMGPVDKFLQRGKIPWKLLMDVLIVIIILVHVVLYSQYRKPFISASQDSFLLRYFPDEFFDEDSSRRVGLTDSTEGYNTFFYLDADEAISWIKTISDRYFSFSEDNPDTFIYASHNPRIYTKLNFQSENFRSYLSSWEGHKEVDSEWMIQQDSKNSSHNFLNEKLFGRTQNSARSTLSSKPIPPSAQIADLKDGVPSLFFLPSSKEYEEVLTKDNRYGLFAFTNTSLFDSPRELFDHLNTLQLHFDIINLDIIFNNKYPKCYRWTLYLEFDCTKRGTMVPLKIYWEHSECIVQASYYWLQVATDPLTYMQFVIIAASLISFVLNVNHIFHRMRLYRKRKKQFNDRTVRDLFSVYITFWHWLVFFKDLFNIIGYILYLVASALPTRLIVLPALFSSMGILLALIGMVRYMQFGNPYYFMTIKSLEKGVPDLFRAICGVFPLFLGFACCGTMWFGDYSSYFDSIGESCMTLFTITNGDVLIDTFHMLYAFNNWRRFSGRVYIYVYVVLFVVGCWNIFLMIMENVYFSIREALDKEPEEEREAAAHGAATDLFYTPPVMDDLIGNPSPSNGDDGNSSGQHEEPLVPDVQDLNTQTIYADVLCDSIEKKLSNRHQQHIGAPLSPTQSILIDQLRLWTKEILSQQSVTRKRRNTFHALHSSEESLDSLHGAATSSSTTTTPPPPATRRRRVTFSSSPLKFTLGSSSKRKSHKRRTSSILKTSANFVELRDMDPLSPAAKEGDETKKKTPPVEEHTIAAEPENVREEDTNLLVEEEDATDGISADDLIRELDF